jgi:hypothetical protein
VLKNETIQMHQIPNWEEEKKNGKKKDLEAINGEKTTEDAFLETSTQYYHIILFIHDSEDRHDVFFRGGGWV